MRVVRVESFRGDQSPQRCMRRMKYLARDSLCILRGVYAAVQINDLLIAFHSMNSETQKYLHRERSNIL
jgi:hypothetical protein